MRSTIILASLLAPSLALAHIAQTSPTPRGADQKAQPCGGVNSVRGTNVHTYAPGATIEVTWKETIEHPGHFRISFDPDGQDFTIPPDATTSTMGTDPLVLVDLIADVGGAVPAGGRPYTQTVTLPNVECTNCTLQLIQLMTDGAYTGAADIYFQCADISLVAGTPAQPDAGVPMATDDAAPMDPGGGGGGQVDGGCSTSGGGSSALLVLLGLVGLRRYRRRQ